jgi:hypothetical protein
MPTLSLKGKLGRVAAAAAMVGVAATSFIGQAPTAGADPQQLTALIGLGSDTIQDVTNAYAGFTNSVNYVPLQSGTTKQQLISFDAQNPASPTNKCVTVKTGAGSQYRSNGSSEGRRALSRAIDGTVYGPTTSPACANKVIGGQIDFARSSAGPASGDAGTDLTYIPFSRDGIGVAYVAAGGLATPKTSFTRAELTQLFTATTIPVNIGGVNIYPCGIQNGSGTFSFWNTVTTATTTQEAAATATCNAATTTTNSDGRIEENNGTSLQQKADALAASSGGPIEVVAGFSGGSFIAQSNNVSPNSIPTTGNLVNLGTITNDGTGANLGAPATGTAPNLVPSSTYYASTVFGRNLYYVVDSAKLAASGSLGLKLMFVSTGATSTIPGVPANNTAVVCQSAAQTTANAFGFLSISTCGSTTLKGSLLAGVQ